MREVAKGDARLPLSLLGVHALRDQLFHTFFKMQVHSAERSSKSLGRRKRFGIQFILVSS